MWKLLQVQGSIKEIDWFERGSEFGLHPSDPGVCDLITVRCVEIPSEISWWALVPVIVHDRLTAFRSEWLMVKSNLVWSWDWWHSAKKIVQDEGAPDQGEEWMEGICLKVSHLFEGSNYLYQSQEPANQNTWPYIAFLNLSRTDPRELVIHVWIYRHNVG